MAETSESSSSAPEVRATNADTSTTETKSKSQRLQKEIVLLDAYCFGLEELPNAARDREGVARFLNGEENPQEDDSSLLPLDPLFIHLAHGLAYTTGSALGSTPPSHEACHTAYTVPNKAGLTAGSRAWSKHSHRSMPLQSDDEATDKRTRSAGWWGVTAGPVLAINEKSLALFWKIMSNATWRNLHWLPHQVLVYEVRVSEGYGMRWSRDEKEGLENRGEEMDRPWTFRGFLEPSMENGHELKWRHQM